MLRRMLFTPPPAIAYESVDLGLSVKWATCNVGACSPEELGLYFQFGDIEGWRKEQIGVEKIFGYYDYKTDLYNKYGTGSKFNFVAPEDDAAHVILGDKWRMPTFQEYIDLINNCNYAYVNNYQNTDVPGILFTSKKNSSIQLFFPASGFASNSKVVNPESGYYWIGEIEWGNVSDLYFVPSGGCTIDGVETYQGLPIRAVLEK